MEAICRPQLVFVSQLVYGCGNDRLPDVRLFNATDDDQRRHKFMRWYKFMKRQLQWMTLLCLALLGDATTSAHATQAEPYYLKSFDVDIEIETSGDLLVTETLNYVFTGNASTKRVRRIPLNSVDRITDVQAYENGNKLRTKTSARKNQMLIRWRHQLEHPGTRTFVLQYRAQGAVRIDERHDQVVWPAVFGNHQTRIEASQVTVRVPPALADQIQHASHYGVGAEMRRVDARTVTFSPHRALQPDEGLTVKLYLPHGRLHTDGSAWQRGEDAAYRLPGLVGYIDTLMFIGLIIALPAIWVLAASQKQQWEMERTARQRGTTNRRYV